MDLNLHRIIDRRLANSKGSGLGYRCDLCHIGGRVVVYDDYLAPTIRYDNIGRGISYIDIEILVALIILILDSGNLDIFG